MNKTAFLLIWAGLTSNFLPLDPIYADRAQKKPLPGQGSGLCERRRANFDSELAGDKPGSGLDQFFERANKCAKSLCQQAGIKRLLKRFVDCRTIERDGLSVVGQ